MSRNLIVIPSQWERWEHRLRRMKRPERMAAVDKIEDLRKPEDFIGHRNRTWRGNLKAQPICLRL